MQGSKIRSTYIAFARKEKKRLESAIENCQKDIAMREEEVARVQGALVTSHFDKFLTSSQTLWIERKRFLQRSLSTRRTRVRLVGTPPCNTSDTCRSVVCLPSYTS